MAINKIVSTFDEAIADVFDGALLHIGQFGGPAETPSYIIAALARKGVKNLTVTGNGAGRGITGMWQLRQQMKGLLPLPEDFYDIGLLVEERLIKKGILAFPAASGSAEWPFEKQLKEGTVEVELIGQGNLVERIRAARAGIAAIWTPVGPGTIAGEGKEIRDFDGVPHQLETALKADFSLIRAHKADRWGNLVYRGTSRTFNASMAGAANITVVEVDEIVELGELDPECIITPGIYIDRVVVRPKEPRTWEQPA